MSAEEKSVSKNTHQGYFSGALEEFSKVTWPTKNQAALLTAIVVAVTLILAILTGLYDYGLTRLYEGAAEMTNSEETSSDLPVQVTPITDGPVNVEVIDPAEIPTPTQ